MARYYLDTCDSETYIEDDEGQELDSILDARAEALHALSGIALDRDFKGNRETLAVSVRDEAGRVVLRAALELCVEPNVVANADGAGAAHH